MRISFALLLCSAILGVALPTTGATAQSAVSPVALTPASRLVDLTIPTEAIQNGARDAFASNFRAGFLRSPRGQAVNQIDPAILDTAIRGGISKLDEVVAAVLVDVKSRASASYASHMTPEELDAAVRFYSGSAGRKLVENTPALATGGDIRQILDPTELADFAAFGRSPAGRKIEALKGQQTRDTNEVVNRAFASNQAKIEEAAMLAAQAYMQARRK